MQEIIGDYKAFIEKADELLTAHNINTQDVVQCDTICYRVETNERYDEIKQQLGRLATMIDESTVNGRLIAVYAPQQPLVAGDWQSISYIEVPQPKPNNAYSEGIDHVQYVTRQRLSDFQYAHDAIPFEEKGLANSINPLLKLVGDDVSVKFHDKHMGSVIELENKIQK